jgi:two-component system chemotaxis response regulator CheB
MSENVGHNIIVIGASMGGIEAMKKLLASLPGNIGASLFAVLHLHPNSPSMLHKMLATKTSLPIKFAEDGAVPRQGMVYLAPPDHHLILEEKRMILSHGPRENRFRPAIDTLFRSAAVAHTTRVIGVVLTGMLDDGSAGLQAIKECGGIAVVQDPADADFPEMPKSALNAVKADHCVSLEKMAELLAELTLTPAAKPQAVPTRLKQEVSMSKGIIEPDIEANILGTPAPFICPDCGGSLSELTEGNVMRYRCHEGHAFTALSFLDAQWEKVEYSLWAAVRVMEEQANMLKKMAKQHGQNIAGTGYEERAGELTTHAMRLKDYLLYNASKKE